MKSRSWHPSPAATGTVVVGLCTLLAGVLLGQADVALIGVPLVLAVVLGRSQRPTGSTSVSFEPGHPTEVPGVIEETLHVVPAPGADVVHVRVFAPGHRPVEAVLPGGGPRALPLRLASERTGPQRTFHVDVRARGVADVTTEDATSVEAAHRLVLPEAAHLGRVPVSPRLRGLTGPRASRRLGDGSELRDVHPLAPGDRLRRVDWRATARRSPTLESLHVRRTFATAEAAAVLVIDSRDDVGPDLHTWRGSEPQRVDEATSLDLARHAAASVATALVGAGDRVGLEDLARRRRPLAPATGKRHLRRILHALAVAAPVGDPSHRVRPPQVPTDAIVYLFTTLLDSAAPDLVEQWVERGVPVVVIDTLPAVQPVSEKHLRLAWRVTAMERADRMRALAARGVPVLQWAGRDREQAATRFELLVRSAERHQPTAGAGR
ncbi:protein of unknown function DUF58 [Xylanimonas cellulosilytica DSM 15894]|uniref:DUF58 domain-containing protein n=1 Tax=Xylanimonas cellulosilytica (strain DSM 15894 / JCM 12276 / CECT 5975 / KCTC 9989 / LMG 20990 / NBRC 107835 / XIL07) TaxID=446471 RepID=D1BSW6_XYLCX|nr:DUF58 domain-containing protein [Xylanimonas cellulosilytica]ACZ30808.1 protein of unknown function DUF58 [Xylanimonas cellulosilytica DSM 15894]